MTKYPNRDPSKKPAPDNDGSQGRTEAVTFYLTPDEKQAVKREADEIGDTLSTYCVRLLRRQRQQEGLEEKADELNVEQRFDELASKAIDRIEESVESVEDATEDLNDIQRTAGTYPIVNFRLLMRQYSPPEPWVNDEFALAATKLTKPVGDHDPTAELSSDDNSGGGDEENTNGDDSQGGKTVDDLLDR
ncbi:plasmid mobilization protein [Halalkalicoccus subterraneus]|uniref:plasmid mobilization protein n=1 Tax=Halalkalicoccus subterraneus TaxID=2675002 RepID=UPI001B8772FF|nr:hypothetical protein [Halalkalicoccus subterraneus]